MNLNSLGQITTNYVNQKRANQQQVDATNYYINQKRAKAINLEDPIETEEVFTNPKFAVNSAIGVIAENDKTALVKLLQKQGSFVTPLSSKKAIIDSTFKAIQDSPKFRQDLENYVVSEVTGIELPKPKSQINSALIKVAESLPKLKKDRLSKIESLNSNFSSFSDFDDNFANVVKEKTGVGNALSTIFSQENINTAFGLGMNVLATRMNANAQKGTNQQAIDFEKAKTENALAQARILEAQGRLPQVTPTGSEKKKWVMPVAIGGGILLLGTIIYFVAKKK
jgi:uncharacterized protein YoxC